MNTAPSFREIGFMRLFLLQMTWDHGKGGKIPAPSAVPSGFDSAPLAVILRERSDGRIFSSQDPSPQAQDANGRAEPCSSPQNSQARFGDPSRSRRTPRVILRERSDGRIFSFQDPSPGAQDDNRRAGACLPPLPPSGRLLIAGRCSTHWGWLFCKPGAAGCQKMQAGGAAVFGITVNKNSNINGENRRFSSLKPCGP